MVKSNGGGAGIKRARVGTDNALPQVGHLQTLVVQILLDELRHRPLEKQFACFVITAQANFDLLACGSFADPEIALTRRPQRVAQSPQHFAHGLPALDILRREGANLSLALLVVVPQLDAGAVEK